MCVPKCEKLTNSRREEPPGNKLSNRLQIFSIDKVAALGVCEEELFLVALMQEQGGHPSAVRERNLCGVVGLNVDDEEAGGHLDGELGDLAVCEDRLHSAGILWHVKVLDLHELVEGVVSPHEEDDLLPDAGDHEGRAPGVNNRVVEAALGLPDLDVWILLRPELGVGLLLGQGLQTVHPNVAVAPADAHQNTIVLQHGDGDEFRLWHQSRH